MGNTFKQILFSLFALIAISAFPNETNAQTVPISFYVASDFPNPNCLGDQHCVVSDPTNPSSWYFPDEGIAGCGSVVSCTFFIKRFGSAYGVDDGSTWSIGNFLQPYPARYPGSLDGLLTPNTWNYIWIQESNEYGGWFYVDGDGNPVPPTPEPDDTTTRIVDFNPQDGATTTSPVDFMLQVYINEADITSIKGVRLTFHNIDQNVLISPLTGFFNPNDIYFLEASATSTGLLTYNFDDIPLADGNYRIEACIQRNYLLGFILNPFSPINDCQSHQFIVGAPTFIGNVSQALWKQTNEFYQGFSSTTSTTTVSSACNPLNGSFDLIECGAYMLVPDGQTLKVTLENARDGFLERMPWGYFTRFFTIMSMSTTTPLPDFNVNLPLGGEYTSFNFTSMIGGALEEAQGLLEEDIVDPLYNKSIEDVLKPILTACLAMSVLGYIVNDIIHGVRSHGRGPRNST